MGHGTCIKSICECIGGWSGDMCQHNGISSFIISFFIRSFSLM